MKFKYKVKATILVAVLTFAGTTDPKDLNPDNISNLLNSNSFSSFSKDSSKSNFKSKLSGTGVRQDIKANAQGLGQDIVYTATREMQSIKGDVLHSLRKAKTSLKN